MLTQFFFCFAFLNQFVYARLLVTLMLSPLITSVYTFDFCCILFVLLPSLLLFQLLVDHLSPLRDHALVLQGVQIERTILPQLYEL